MAMSFHVNPRAPPSFSSSRCWTPVVLCGNQPAFVEHPHGMGHGWGVDVLEGSTKTPPGGRPQDCWLPEKIRCASVAVQLVGHASVDDGADTTLFSRF